MIKQEEVGDKYGAGKLFVPFYYVITMLLQCKLGSFTSRIYIEKALQTTVCKA